MQFRGARPGRAQGSQASTEKNRPRKNIDRIGGSSLRRRTAVHLTQLTAIDAAACTAVRARAQQLVSARAHTPFVKWSR